EVETCGKVAQRAATTLDWTIGNIGVLSVAFGNLGLGRALLYHTVLAMSPNSTADAKPSAVPQNKEFQQFHGNFDAALDGFRRAGIQGAIARGLLFIAWLRFLEGDTEAARNDLDEAWNIADRGPMRLHMADIHVYRARLFFREKEFPWNKNPDG